MKLSSEDVAQYLEGHPEFFEEYADLLASIYVPHPHGGRAIPISERQIVTLREKNKLLEDKLRDLIRFGEENDALGDKIHRLALALLSATGLQSLIHLLNFNLREDFAVPHVALRLWREGGANPAVPEFAPTSADVHSIAESLAHPYCGHHAADEVKAWFGEDAPHLRSFALAALRHDKTFGLLVMASEDLQRFYPEMGTLYVKRLGELASAALARHLE